MKHPTSNIQPPTLKALALLALFAFQLSALATDISTGYSFSSGEQNVTHTKLNNAVNNATINSGFYTDKSALTETASGDLVLIYSASLGALRKMTVDNLNFSNIRVITNQTEDVTPATGDFVLTFDVSAGTLKKTTLLDLVFTNDFLINGRTNWPNPNRATTSLLAYDTVTGQYSKLSRSNLFWQFFEFNNFTNQPLTTIPTNHTDLLLIWDAAAGTNKTTTLRNLLTNTPVLIPTNAATLFLAETGQVKQVTISNLLNMAGRQLQSLAADTNAMTTIVAATPGGTIPVDDTIPQSNEGTQLLTQVITPGDSNNIIEIECSVPFGLAVGVNGSVAMSICQDSTTNAIAAVSLGFDNSLKDRLMLKHRMVAGTMAATTFKLRVGTTTGTITVNGEAGARQFGGVSRAWLIVRELKP